MRLKINRGVKMINSLFLETIEILEIICGSAIAIVVAVIICVTIKVTINEIKKLK
jgi:hypothetical protein